MWPSQSATHSGTKRTSNEDVTLCDASQGLYIVCDGTRHALGATIAQQSSQALLDAWKRAQDLRTRYQGAPTRAHRQVLEKSLAVAIRDINTHLYGATLSDTSRVGAFSTLDAVAVMGDQAIVAHVGDGRVYLIREGRWYQLTRDHTRAEEMRQSGLWKDDALKNSPFRQELTRALGAQATCVPDLFSIPLHAGDQILLASNGLTDLFWESALKEEAQRIQKSSPTQSLAQNLVNFAVEHRTTDNVSVTLVQVPSAEQLKSTSVEVAVAQRILVNPAVSEALQKVTVFRGLRDNARGFMNLLGQTTVAKYQPGETLLVQGEISDSLLVILEGEVEVLEFGTVVARRKKGEVIGEIGFFTGVPRTASVIAHSPTHALILKLEDFEYLLGRDPRLGVDLAKGVIQELGRKLLDKKAQYT